MKANYFITGAGMLSLVVSGFLASLATGFLVLGICLVTFGLIFDMDKV